MPRLRPPARSTPADRDLPDSTAHPASLSRGRQGGKRCLLRSSDRPWIPVRYVHGASGPPAAGLAGLFLRAHEIADITVPVPPAALRPVADLVPDRGADQRPGRPGRPWTASGRWKQARNRALERRAVRAPRPSRGTSPGTPTGSTCSDPARPWLQDPRLAGQCPKNTGVNKLVMGRATGNNLVWLSHDTDLAPQPVPLGRGRRGTCWPGCITGRAGRSPPAPSGARRSRT